MTGTILADYMIPGTQCRLSLLVSGPDECRPYRLRFPEDEAIANGERFKHEDNAHVEEALLRGGSQHLADCPTLDWTARWLSSCSY